MNQVMLNAVYIEKQMKNQKIPAPSENYISQNALVCFSHRHAPSRKCFWVEQQKLLAASRRDVLNVASNGGGFILHLFILSVNASA